MNRFVLLAAVLLPLLATADEGMWTFDNPPNAALKAAYGVELDSAWLDRVRAATVRLENGCTASIVSGSGLILTNHHCAHECIAQNSSADRNLLGNGFLAPSRPDELRCPDAAASVLMRMEQVTDRVHAATRGLAPAKAAQERRAELTRLEQVHGHATQELRSLGSLPKPATADTVARSEGVKGVLQKIGLELEKTLTAIGDKSGL